MLFAAVGIHWAVSSDPAEPESAAEGTPTTESQRREILEELVAAINAQSRDGRTPPTVQAPPPRDSSPTRADPQTGTPERPPAPEGYAYATFERAGLPTQSAVTGDEKARLQAPAWLSSPDSLAAVAANAEAADRDWSFGWVRLGPDARLQDAEAELAALGVVVEGQAGDLLRARLPGDPDRLQAVAALPNVDGLGAQPPSAKLPAAFAEEARGKAAHEIVPVFVTLAAAGDSDGRWRAALERLGVVVGDYDAHTRSYIANVEYGGLDALAAADFVAFVEPVGVVEAANDTAVPAMGANAYWAYTDDVGFAGTAGQGVAVGVMDTGLNINHLDIESGRLSVCGANFVLSLEEEQDLWVDAGLHGTHVTTTIAGNGAAERRYAGMAPLVPHIRFAKVLSRRGSGASSWIFGGMDFLAEPSACGAAGWADDSVAPPIVNMSLSARSLTFEGRDASARKLDAVVYDTGQLYVVANSNAGVHGFSNYGAAKNSLPVGAAWDSGELASFSSHGPTADGRLAPLVVGTGVHVHSARGDGSRGGYVRFNGTSMSSPSVAGVAALTMDAQPDLVGNAALARAHLMASAVKPDAWLDAEDAFPSDNTNGPGALHARFGLGKVSGTTSVFDRPEDDGWESGGWHGILLEAGETSEHVIDVPADASRLDVVLTWDEPPADVIANTVLNDLDLWLERPFPRLDADLGSRSRRDNVEWVIVRNPQSGRWRARVEAERIHGEKPRAALAYTIIRGPATPQLSIVAASDALGPNGDVELTVSTDGYVAAGTRLVMDCRTAEGAPCHPNGTYQGGAGARPAFRTVGPGDFVLLGEIRPDEPRTVRFRGLGADAEARMHFTVTGWNAKGDTAVVFAEEAEDVEFAAPPNDDFVKAVDLEGPVQGDLLTATTESGEPAFEDGTERPAASVWYRWTAKDDGAVHFSLAPTEAFSYPPYPDRELYEAFETRVDVYEGNNIAGAQPVASAPWGASFLAERGSDYLVRVAGRARAVPFKLSFRQGGAPENDAFDAAVVLEGGEGQVEGTNAGATLEAGEQFGPLAATVWYEWTAPDDGWYEFGSSAAHLKVLAFEDAASVGDVRLVSGVPQEDLRFPAKEGNVYRIAVASQGADSAGVEFELSWSVLEDYEAHYDLLENASAFPDEESSSRLVFVGSHFTVEPGEPAESGVRTAWYSWTAPASGEYTWRYESVNTRLTAFKGGALDALVPVGSSSGPTGAFSFKVDVGEPYRFAGAAAGEAVFTLRGNVGGTVVWGPTPSNNAWSSATPIVAATGNLRASNRFATIETGERIHAVGHSSLWWSFEAPEPGWYRFWIDESSLPFTLSAYADNPDTPPGGLELIASSERGVAHGIEVYLDAEEAGARFAIRVGTRGDDEGGEFTLNWEDSEPPVWLRYLGRTADRYEYVDDDGRTFAASNFRSIALDGSGRALYAGTNNGVAVFDRNGDDGSLNFVDLVRGESHPRLLWDVPRNRLLVFHGYGDASVRSYVPTDDDVLDLEDVGEVSVAAGSPGLLVDPSYTTVLAHPTGSFLYFVSRYHEVRVFSIGEDGTLAPVQLSSRNDAVAVSNGGGHVYAVRGGILTVFESGETGELTEVASLGLPHAHEGIAVTDDDGRVFTWGAGGSAVVDVEDPARPALLGTVDLPQQNSWNTPVCRFATARAARPAADVLCTNGDAYALAWRDGKLAVTDLVADWRANRFNDVVPDFGRWNFRTGYAASRDGRHAYASTPDRGITVFERVGNTVPDDHGDSQQTATSLASLPGSGEGELDWAGDRDMFRIEVDRPGTLMVYTKGDTDTYGRLTNTDGDLLAEDDDSGVAPNFEMKADVKAGTYYVEVSGADGTATGSYTLSVDFVADEGGVGFTAQRAIATDADGANAVFAADLDGDGDVDVLTASHLDDKIAWHENLGDKEFSLQRVVTTEADGAQWVHAVDLDGDGDADVVSASKDDEKIAWYENLGAGSFSEQRVIADDASDAKVHAADLDGDGDADVLSASGAANSIVWYRNDGAGSFVEQRIVTTDAEGTLFVFPADLDGDGDADVVAVTYNERKIAWYRNDGVGSFGQQRVITTDVIPLRNGAVHAADLDSDGDADVLSATSGDDKVAWYENQGTGSFSTQKAIATTADYAISVHAADLDGDGDGDVLSASHYDDKIAWYESLGDGSYSDENVISDVAEAAFAVFTADLDGDGDADVLSASYSDDKIAWYENLSNHGDDHGDDEESATLATALPAFLHGVLESDGDNDMFRFATGRGTLKVYTNGPTDTEGWLLDEEGDLLVSDDRAGNFLIEAEVEAGVHYVDVFGPADATGPYTVSIEFVFADDHGSTPKTATAVASLPWSGPGELERQGDRDVFRIDVDGPGTLTAYTTGATDTYGRLTDADGDVLVEDDDSGDEPNFEIKAGVAAGTYYVEVSGVDGATGSYTLSIEFVADVSIAFGEQRVITTEADDARFVYAADFDGDLRLDVLAYSFRDDTVAWHRNEDQGGFSTRRTINADAGGAVVYVVDLDGDDDPDVLLASEQADTVGWHENLGSGDFSGYRSIATGVDRPRSVGAADLDGDGDADVLAASQDDETVAWYENTGGGVFGDRRVIATAVPGLASVADLDDDGDPDVFSTSFDDDTIGWYENDGTGVFGARQEMGDGTSSVWSLLAADADGDDDLDVVYSSNVGTKVAWFENEGGGEFSSQRRAIESGLGDSRHAFAADLDGDRDQDVLLATLDDDTIGWYRNLGGGEFSARHAIASDVGGAFGVHAGDLDGDGDLDVVSAAAHDDTIAWHENLSDHGDDHSDALDGATLVIAMPAFLYGVLESAGDRDVFRVAAGQGTLRVHSNGPTDTLGRLLDAEGAQLATNDDSGEGLNFLIDTQVAAGVHYVEVRGFSTRTGLTRCQSSS